ncbi:type III pantothenate kinase [Maribacter sp. 2307UL18-2]|uniref:type III pantothenate kinase n=1 Tax=Maribacter sp. 2307UL18-2 TaxID=3386274 RepID=UPI0039BD6803
MNLIVDVGNTATKLAVFHGQKLLFDTVLEKKGLIDEVKEIFDQYPNIRRAMVSSVGEFDTKQLAALSIFCKVYVLNHTTRTPFKNSYATPQSLGVDRIALAAAAFYRNPNGNILVVDAGTCITYDMVNDYGEYLGGAISPGIHMRYRAMHDQTAKLPLLRKEIPMDLIGNSTETSMHSGVVNGVCAEIDGVIDQYKSRFAHLTVILTGGDSQFLSKRLKNTIFADSKFLLRGLNYLLEYNKH